RRVQPRRRRPARDARGVDDRRDSRHVDVDRRPRWRRRPRGARGRAVGRCAQDRWPRRHGPAHQEAWRPAGGRAGGDADEGRQQDPQARGGTGKAHEGSRAAPRRAPAGLLLEVPRQVRPLIMALHFVVDDASGDTIELTGAEAHHASAVRRVREGEEVTVTDGRGAWLTGSVTSVEPKRVTITVAERTFIEAPPRRILLAQALAKGDRDELAVQAATDLDNDGVIPWQATRGVFRSPGA